MTHEKYTTFYENPVFLILIHIHLCWEVFQPINPFFVYFRIFRAFTNIQILSVWIIKNMYMY